MGLANWWRVRRAKRLLDKTYAEWHIQKLNLSSYAVMVRRKGYQLERTLATGATEDEAIIAGGLRAYYEVKG